MSTARAAAIVVAFFCALVVALLLTHVLGREAVTGLIIGGGLGGIVQWRSRIRKRTTDRDRDAGHA